MGWMADLNVQIIINITNCVIQYFALHCLLIS